MCIRDSSNAKGGNLYLYDLSGKMLKTQKVSANSGDDTISAVSYTHLRAHETVLDLVCRLLLEKKKKTNSI